MVNNSKDIVTPKEAGIFRIIFLYVGQGDATLLVIPNGDEYKYVLIDTNNDKKNGGIDISAFLNDLLDDDLDVFINTHPHKDHLTGIKQIHDTVGIKELWHSGHKPGKEHDDAYQEMKNVIKSIGNENEFVLFGTNDSNKIRKSDKETEIFKELGEINFIVLSPAEFVSEDIDDENPKDRYKRIHEQCAVIKFSYGDNDSSLLITGDSDKKSWRDNITTYHNEKLPSEILSASHHGSRTFFKDDEKDDEPFEDHIKKIEPSYLIISSPKQSDSPHGHPHNDALDMYKEYIDENNILHLGENKECVIVDIPENGNIDIRFDKDLIEHYGFDSDEKETNVKESATKASVAVMTSRIDEKPMG